jgi:hypothetical protein
MHKPKFLAISIILLMLLLVAGPLFDASASPRALGTSPTWGAAGSYSVEHLNVFS